MVIGPSAVAGAGAGVLATANISDGDVLALLPLHLAVPVVTTNMLVRHVQKMMPHSEALAVRQPC
jgi:hypothetical protein